MLTREKLLAMVSRAFRDVTLPADCAISGIAGETIRVWAMNARQQGELQAGLIDPQTGNAIADRLYEIKARKVIASVGDEQGTPLFTADDLESVLNFPAAFVDLIAGVSDELNEMKLSPEEIAKN